jgi:hypothetical protein
MIFRGTLIKKTLENILIKIPNHVRAWGKYNYSLFIIIKLVK